MVYDFLFIYLKKIFIYLFFKIFILQITGKFYSDKIELINACRAYVVCCLDEIDVGNLV